MNHDSRTTAAFLKKQTSLRPTLAMVLGSGFQHSLSELTVVKEIPFREASGFPAVGVSGHAGKIVFGTFGNVSVVVLKGRAHFYEGHSLDKVTFPIRVLADLGIKTVLLTNAAGGITRDRKSVV